MKSYNKEIINILNNIKSNENILNIDDLENNNHIIRCLIERKPIHIKFYKNECNEIKTQESCLLCKRTALYIICNNKYCWIHSQKIL